MLSPYNLPDYKSRYFEYNYLTKVHGRPHVETTLNTYKQLKSSAQRVPTTLSGGQLGYVSLVVPNTSYNSIPNFQQFNKPADPGIFQPVNALVPPVTHAEPIPVAPVLTNTELSQQLAVHNETKRLYNKV